MSWFSSWRSKHPRVPEPGEVEEAERFPNGWVYRIAGKSFGPNDAIPPEAIIGAWKVDASGLIVGKFVENPKYDPNKMATLIAKPDLPSHARAVVIDDGIAGCSVLHHPAKLGFGISALRRTGS